jgi:hypothetical protein
LPNLKINTRLPRVVIAPDRFGEFIRRDKSTTINISVTSEIHSKKGSISFNTTLKVNRCPRTEEAKATEAVVSWLEKNLPSILSRANYWNFFENTLLTADVSSEELREWPREPLLVSLDMTPHLQEILDESIDYISKVRRRFNESKEKLLFLANTNLPLGFAQSVGEANTLLKRIEYVLSTSTDVGGYEPSKARNAMHNYQDLARRKIELNSNYQRSLRSLKSFAAGVTFPTTFDRRPDA